MVKSMSDLSGINMYSSSLHHIPYAIWNSSRFSFPKIPLYLLSAINDKNGGPVALSTFDWSNPTAESISVGLYT